MDATLPPHLRSPDDMVLRVEGLVVEYPATDHRVVQAVSNVSFDIGKGETLGLVGESGCGKSTTGRSVMMLPPPKAGSVRFAGRELTTLPRQELRRTRTSMQMIFQDPISSLNPRRRIRDIIGEGLVMWGHDDVPERVNDLMEQVGLDPQTIGGRRPHQLSGGQCQRVCIARALALGPDLLVCDEPVSALDVSVQAQILNLLEDLQSQYDLTFLFIAHDLAVVKSFSDRIAVMYLGKLCEIGPAEAVYAQPLHPYTHTLLEAVPVPDPHVVIEPLAVNGEMPSPLDPPSGCRFRTRCPRATDHCAGEEPLLREVLPSHYVACHFPLSV